MNPKPGTYGYLVPHFETWSQPALAGEAYIERQFLSMDFDGMYKMRLNMLIQIKLKPYMLFAPVPHICTYLHCIDVDKIRNTHTYICMCIYIYVQMYILGITYIHI